MSYIRGGKLELSSEPYSTNFLILSIFYEYVGDIFILLLVI